ncbi:MAG: tetratricopeptide repeat protein [Gammaproteobacteria bacterium]
MLKQLIWTLCVFTLFISAVKAEDDLTAKINHYTQLLKQNPGNVAILIKRGDLYFKLHQFDQAIFDYSDAIKIDPHADKAYFGRGLALGRNGQIQDGIRDLTIYITRHPNDSHAYTKRGVRYSWLRKNDEAKRDLEKAVSLNPKNAEAHDDLGVILSRRRDYASALKHFTATVSIDPTYAKGWHNLAMVYYIIGQDKLALNAVNSSLDLSPDERNSLLLKAKILKDLGQTVEAEKIKENAEFLPRGNWSERVPVE